MCLDYGENSTCSLRGICNIPCRVDAGIHFLLWNPFLEYPTILFCDNPHSEHCYPRLRRFEYGSGNAMCESEVHPHWRALRRHRRNRLCHCTPFPSFHSVFSASMIRFEIDSLFHCIAAFHFNHNCKSSISHFSFYFYLMWITRPRFSLVSS